MSGEEERENEGRIKEAGEVVHKGIDGKEKGKKSIPGKDKGRKSIPGKGKGRKTFLAAVGFEPTPPKRLEP